MYASQVFPATPYPEITDENTDHGFKVEFPVSVATAFVTLLAYSIRHIIYGAFEKKILTRILHLNDKLVARICLTGYVIDNSLFFGTVFYLDCRFESNRLYRLETSDIVENIIQEIFKKWF